MCGFIGIVNPKTQLNKEEFGKILDVIRHRGPNSKSVFSIDNGKGILGFVRLSIIDIEGGTQPITNEDGTIEVLLNGEIYNYLELREELTEKGHIFTTYSDTEVIVHLYEEHGIEMLGRLRGMFAIALWDDNNKSLYVVRDRIGIKPMYYAQKDEQICFGSEIKPLLRFPEVSKELDNTAVKMFLQYGYIMAPHTIFGDIKKVKPGHYLLINEEGVTEKEYWNISRPIKQEKNLDEIEQDIEKLLRESVRLHMRSDVPIGVFLSGGIDSGVIAALTTQEVGPISTYTMRFEGATYDESEMAALVAKRYGTDHHCYTVSDQQMEELFPKLMWAFDEPLGDSGILPNYLINSLVVEDGIKVVLSGAGGDELFAGYTYYFQSGIEKKLESLGGIVRSLGKIIKFFNPELSRKLIRSCSYNVDRFNHYDERKKAYGDVAIDKLLKKKGIASVSPRDLYESFDGDDLNKVLYTDINTYLVDDLLYLADRSTMINSVEGRVPFLDHILVEYMLGVDGEAKTLGGYRKALLKKMATKYLPEELINLPKQGFSSPIDSWCSGAFGEKMVEVLSSSRCIDRGLYDVGKLKRLLKPGKSRNKNFHLIYLMFTLEMFLRVHVDNSFDSFEEVNGRTVYE